MDICIVQNAVVGCNLKNDRMISVCLQGKPFKITIIQFCAPTTDAEEAEVEWLYKAYKAFLNKHPKKDVIFMTGDWTAKVGSQEISGVTGKFGLGVQNEVVQRLIELCQENALFIATRENNTREDSTHGHHHMVNSEIRLIAFFAAKDGEALYNKNKTRS